jgi:hypothetical protein
MHPNSEGFDQSGVGGPGFTGSVFARRPCNNLIARIGPAITKSLSAVGVLSPQSKAPAGLVDDRESTAHCFELVPATALFRPPLRQDRMSRPFAPDLHLIYT